MRKFKIYTSSGEFNFTENDLEQLKNSNDFIFKDYEFQTSNEQLSNRLSVIVDLKSLFIFIETSNGDECEYKIFESAESSRNEETYHLTREELESFGEHCNDYSSGIFDINQEECYGYNIVDKWLKDNNK